MQLNHHLSQEFSEDLPRGEALEVASEAPTVGKHEAEVGSVEHVRLQKRQDAELSFRE